MSCEELTINGVDYVKKNSTKNVVRDGLEYSIVRCDRAGVFAGYVESLNEITGYAVILDARRIHYWDGAASLSQLATDGTSKPENCRFPVALKKIKVAGVLEVIPATSKAHKSIESVNVWEK